jgi:hypothetical protein
MDGLNIAFCSIQDESLPQQSRIATLNEGSLASQV